MRRGSHRSEGMTAVKLLLLSAAFALALIGQSTVVAAQRLGKPGSGTAGLGSAAGQRPFPEDVFAFPAFQMHTRNPVVRSSQALELVQGNKASSTVVSGQEVAPLRPDGQAGAVSQDSPNVSWQVFRAPSSELYLCAMPQPTRHNVSSEPLSPSELATERQRVLSNALRLLAPLKSTCLFHTLDWFTYSFCYGDQIRQFHALPGTTLPGRTPGADPKQDSYVLGRWSEDVEDVSAGTIESGDVVDKTLDGAASKQNGVAQTSAASLEYDEARMGNTDLMEVISFSGDTGADAKGHQRAERYISQVWSGGTTCDINNEPRSVEVQFHCSTRPGDRISLIKETTTCNYVLVVETPRLCEEPALAFKQEAVNPIQCSRVVPDDWDASSEPSGSGADAPQIGTGVGSTTSQTSPVAEPPTETPLDIAAAAAASAAEAEDDGFHTRGDWAYYGAGGSGTGSGATGASGPRLYDIGWDQEGNLVIESLPPDMQNQAGGPGSDYWEAYELGLEGMGEAAIGPYGVVELRIDVNELLQEGRQAGAGAAPNGAPNQALTAAAVQKVLKKLLEEQLKPFLTPGERTHMASRAARLRKALEEALGKEATWSAATPEDDAPLEVDDAEARPEVENAAEEEAIRGGWAPGRSRQERQQRKNGGGNVVGAAVGEAGQPQRPDATTQDGAAPAAPQQEHQEVAAEQQQGEVLTGAERIAEIFAEFHAQQLLRQQQQEGAAQGGAAGVAANNGAAAKGAAAPQGHGTGQGQAQQPFGQGGGAKAGGAQMTQQTETFGDRVERHYRTKLENDRQEEERRKREERERDRHVEL